MDARSLIGGLVLIVAVCGGSALLSTALSLPVSGFTGLLLIVLPFSALLWFQERKIRQLEEIILSGNRQVRRDVEDQGRRMVLRYEESVRQVFELIDELRKRVYR